jgi:methionine salvage enolase-phosphatase E1
MSSPIKAVVLDIEGTTTPISFVSETLFPYISRELETYLLANWNDEKTKKDVELLRELAAHDKASGVKDVVEIKGMTSKEQYISFLFLFVVLIG